MHTRRHIIFYIASILLLGLFEAAFLDNMRIFGSKADLILVFIMLVGIYMKPTEALILGFVTGIYVDIIYGVYIGFYALIYIYICVALSLISNDNLREQIWWPAVIMPPALLVVSIVESLFARFLAIYQSGSTELYAESYLTHIKTRILPVTFANIIASVIIFVPVWFILRKISEVSSSKARRIV